MAMMSSATLAVLALVCLASAHASLSVTATAANVDTLPVLAVYQVRSLIW